MLFRDNFFLLDPTKLSPIYFHELILFQTDSQRDDNFSRIPICNFCRCEISWKQFIYKPTMKYNKFYKQTNFFA